MILLLYCDPSWPAQLVVWPTHPGDNNLTENPSRTSWPSFTDPFRRNLWAELTGTVFSVKWKVILKVKTSVFNPMGLIPNQWQRFKIIWIMVSYYKYSIFCIFCPFLSFSFVCFYTCSTDVCNLEGRCGCFKSIFRSFNNWLTSAQYTIAVNIWVFSGPSESCFFICNTGKVAYRGFFRL